MLIRSFVQWCNRRGQSAPRDFWSGNFCSYQEKRSQGKKGKWGKKKENWKKEGGKLKKKEKKLQNDEKTFLLLLLLLLLLFFFFFFFLILFIYFFFFCFSLFKTTEICFGSTKIEIFYQEKAFHAGKKSGKITLPLRKNFLLRPWFCSSSEV